jgi:hypothetical protein
MFEYLKFLFKKLKTFDRKLNTIAILQNKFWIRINENEIAEKWFFRDNGRLIISINGNVTEGRYEYLNESNLILEFQGNRILLNQNFIYNDLLLLKKDSDESEFYAFYDSTKFNPNEFVQFIENSRKNDLNIVEIELIDNTTAEVVRELNQQTIVLGNHILINQQLASQSFVETKTKIYELKEGKIDKIFFKYQYKINDIIFTVKQRNISINVMDEIIKYTEPIEDGLYIINYDIGIEIKEYQINAKYKMAFCETFVTKQKFQVYCRRPDEFSLRDLVRKYKEIMPDGNYWLSPFKRLKVRNGKLE